MNQLKKRSKITNLSQRFTFQSRNEYKNSGENLDEKRQTTQEPEKAEIST